MNIIKVSEHMWDESTDTSFEVDRYYTDMEKAIAETESYIRAFNGTTDGLRDGVCMFAHDIDAHSKDIHTIYFTFNKVTVY